MNTNKFRAFCTNAAEQTSKVIPINDRGFVYGVIIKPKESHRMTKAELHEFVRWYITRVNEADGDEIRKLSDVKIQNLYWQQTGKYVSRNTVNRNRKCWFLKDGQIIRIGYEH